MFKKFKEKRNKRREIERWMEEKGEFYLTELIAKCFGWTCECCGSDKDLDAYALNSNWEKDENGMMIHDHRNENLICLCPKCYKKYHENPIEALHHMTNPQIFKFHAKDPRLEKYCK